MTEPRLFNGSTRPSTCTASSSTAIASWSKPASTTCSRRRPVDRVIHGYRRLGRISLLAT